MLLYTVIAKVIGSQTNKQKTDMIVQKEGLLGQRRESSKSQGGQESNGEMNSTEIHYVHV